MFVASHARLSSVDLVGLVGECRYLLYYGSEFQAQLDHAVPGQGIICYGSKWRPAKEVTPAINH